MTILKHLLSKSTFMYGCQCPKRLYLHKFNSKVRNEQDEFQQAIFMAGTNVGILAHDLFPGGANAEPPDTFSYHKSVQKTQALIAAGETIIYEAAFMHNRILCAIDILVMEKGKWIAYEVKGANSIKDTFIMDASLQYYVITQSGLPLEDIRIVHLNKEYVKRGALDVQGLFVNESVLESVLENQDYITENAKTLMGMVLSKEEPIIQPGDHCYKPYECDFTNHCYSLYPKEEEEERDFGPIKIDKPAIKEFLSELVYPLFYFDFETIMPAVPIFDESRPYQQLAFQYSLHVQKEKNGSLEHYEYLGDGVNDPRKALAEKLIKELGKKGSIIVWNQSFEISRLKEMARDFPEFEKPLLKIIDRVVDLMVPFRRKEYSHPDFKGSYSIKKVLPVLVPELSYGNLEVQDGGTASMLYANLKDHPKSEQEKQRNSLLEYCKLDTLAMVKILERMV